MPNSIIVRLRQNAVSLISKDQSVRNLADIVAELCMVCEEQEKELERLQQVLVKQLGPEAAG